MVESIGDAAVTVSVIGNPVPVNPIPESEMDALLLGRTKVSCKHHGCDCVNRCVRNAINVFFIFEIFNGRHKMRTNNNN